jgi:hypothetical protein
VILCNILGLLVFDLVVNLTDRGIDSIKNFKNLGEHSIKTSILGIQQEISVAYSLEVEVKFLAYSLA